MTSPQTLVRSCCALVAAAVIAASAASASAALVGADFSGSFPTNWNAVNGAVVNLVDETGAATAVDVEINGVNLTASQTLNAGTIPSHTNALTNLSGFNYFPGLITISDLVPNAAYKFWLFAVYDNLAGGGAYDANVLGAGPVVTFNFPNTTQGDLSINGVVGSSANTLDSYAALITASATGTIEISFANSQNSGETPVAGVAIEFDSVAIPTPSAAAGVLALAALGLTRRRRNA